MSVRHRVAVYVATVILFWSGTAQAASFTIRKVVAAGDAAPQGGTFAQFDPVANAGAILFDALVEKDEPFHGVYLARGSSLSRIVAVSDPSPLGGTSTTAAWKEKVGSDVDRRPRRRSLASEGMGVIYVLGALSGFKR